MANPKRCLLLLNVGTPDTPKKPDVRRYLSEFLNDKYVVDLPWLSRKLLVNGIIIPFRVNTSVKIYSELWKKHGRVLDTLTKSLSSKLQAHFGSTLTVKYAMRYGNPSIAKVVQEIENEAFEELIIFPLFPQNAMSTTTTAVVAVRDEIRRARLEIKVRSIPAFFGHPFFPKAVAAQSVNYDWHDYDYVVFSYHGLPNRHIKKAHKEIGYKKKKVENCSCEQSFKKEQTGCYKAECYESSRLVAKHLGIPRKKYTVAFQSRLSKNWLKPFSDATVSELAQSGVKKLLVFTPSFVIDCLETLNEIGEEYADIFYRYGGEKLDLVPCLNDSKEMVKLTEMLIEEMCVS